MLKRFYPDDYVDSAYEIPYEELYKKGYRGIVFDVDNTLVEHGAPVTERAIALFERLRKTGYDTCIISNNKEPRVRPLARRFIQNMSVMRKNRPQRIILKLWNV